MTGFLGNSREGLERCPPWKLGDLQRVVKRCRGMRCDDRGTARGEQPHATAEGGVSG